jgi:hypothetical protein
MLRYLDLDSRHFGVQIILPRATVQIPTKPATHTDLKPATVPI